jgi:hypothetical protein
MKMSKGNIVAALAGLLFMTATSASAQDATSIVQQAYGQCKAQMADLKEKHGKRLTEGDMRYCSCIAGASALGRAARQGISDAVLERVTDACQAGFQGTQ